MISQGGKPKDFTQMDAPKADIANPELAKTFKAVQGLLNEELVKSINGVFTFDLGGELTFFPVADPG